MTDLQTQLILNGAMFLANLLAERNMTLLDLAQRQQLARANGRELDAQDLDMLARLAQEAIDSIA